MVRRNGFFSLDDNEPFRNWKKSRLLGELNQMIWICEKRQNSCHYSGRVGRVRGAHWWHQKVERTNCWSRHNLKEIALHFLGQWFIYFFSESCIALHLILIDAIMFSHFLSLLIRISHLNSLLFLRMTCRWRRSPSHITLKRARRRPTPSSSNCARSWARAPSGRSVAQFVSVCEPSCVFIALPPALKGN